MTYVLTLLSAAQRDLARLPSKARYAVWKELRRLEDDPRHRGVRPVRSQPGWLRARVGELRVVFVIDDRERRVMVRRIVRRDKAYQQ